MLLLALVLTLVAAVLFAVEFARTHALSTAGWMLLALAWAAIFYLQYHPA